MGIFLKKEKKSEKTKRLTKQLKAHTHTHPLKEAKAVSYDRLLRKCLYSLLRLVHSVQRMDLIQEFITKLQMQSLFVFWHQRGPRKWIGVWTNWHHSHKRSGKKFSNVEVMSSFSFSLRKFSDFLWKLCSFFFAISIQLRISFIVQAIQPLLQQIIMLEPHSL